MQVLITTEVNEWSEFTQKDFKDRKALLLWNDEQIVANGLCRVCNACPCDGRMTVRKDVSFQYGMGVCMECFMATK